MPRDGVIVATFVGLARSMLENAPKEMRRDFSSLFGTKVEVVFIVWQKLTSTGNMPHGGKPKHLLWALLFLKTYATETIMLRIIGSGGGVQNRTTLRKWVWLFVHAIESLKPLVVKLPSLVNAFLLAGPLCRVEPNCISQYFPAARSFFLVLSSFSCCEKIRWSNRLRKDRGRTCKVTVDGTDCPIQEPYPFDKKWYSHKFKGPGMRYEVAVAIQTGDIVWVYGPFKAGAWNDLKIFRHALRQRLAPGEMVEADKGYRGERTVRTPRDFVSWTDKRAKDKARARHETVNNRLKQWKAIGKEAFRHDRTKHGPVFNAIAVVTQLAFENGDPPWQIRY